MVPQTHAVTLVVLVPRDQADNTDVGSRIVRIVAQTGMVDVHSGEDLGGKELRPYDRAVEKIMEQKGLVAKPSSDQGDAKYGLELDLARNDRTQFAVDFKSYFPDSLASPDYLWSDMEMARDLDPYQTAILIVPQVHTPAFLEDPNNLVFIASDSGQQVQVLVNGGVGLYPDAITATLMVGKDRPLLFPATQISNANGASMTAIFPSLKASNIDATAPDSLQVKLRAVFSPTTNTSAHPISDSEGGTVVHCRYVTAKESVAASQLAMNVATPSVVMGSNNTGTINLNFTSVKDPATVTVSGADVANISPAAVEASYVSSGKITVTGPGLVILSLSNLATGGTVTIKATDGKTSLDPIKLPIVAGSNSNQKQNQN